MVNNGCFDMKQAVKLDNEGRIKELRPYELAKDIAGVRDGMVCTKHRNATLQGRPFWRG